MAPYCALAQYGAISFEREVCRANFSLIGKQKTYQ